MPNQEPASACIFGNSSMRVGTRGSFARTLKLSSRLFFRPDKQPLGLRRCWMRVDWFLELANRMSLCKPFPFTTQSVVIKIPERKLDCQEPKAFRIFSHQNRSAILMTNGKGERLSLAWRIRWYRGEARLVVLWCESNSWDEDLRLHTLTRLASHNVGKQHRTNNDPQNHRKRPRIKPTKELQS